MSSENGTLKLSYVKMLNTPCETQIKYLEEIKIPLLKNKLIEAIEEYQYLKGVMPQMLLFEQNPGQ